MFDSSGLGEGVKKGDAYNGMKIPGTWEVKRGTPLGLLRGTDIPDGHAGFDPQVSHDWNSSRKYRKKFTVQFGDVQGQNYTRTAIVDPYYFAFSSEAGNFFRMSRRNCRKGCLWDKSRKICTTYSKALVYLNDIALLVLKCISKCILLQHLARGYGRTIWHYEMVPLIKLRNHMHP